MDNLGEVLTELSRYSMPSLREFDNGWWCSAELRVQVKGGEFKVSSEYRHATPLSAATECLHRVQDMLKDIHKLSTETPYNKPRLEAL